MKANTHNTLERKTLADVRTDCKRWRRLVSRYVQADGRVAPRTDEEYKVLHGRILANCRNLAAEESIPEFRRRIVRQLDELLQPWSSASSLKEAPSSLVEDLVQKESTLEDRLRGKHTSRASRLKRLIVTASVAGLAGVALAILLGWFRASTSSPVSQSVLAVTATISAYIRSMSFVEHFAIAVLVSWLFGTWLLSNVYKS